MAGPGVEASTARSCPIAVEHVRAQHLSHRLMIPTATAISVFRGGTSRQGPEWLRPPRREIVPHTKISFGSEATAAAVRDARHRISAKVEEWGALDGEASFRLNVVTAELLTDSLLHANGPMAVEVILDRDFLVVSVFDGGSAVPRTCEVGTGEEYGRAVIEALCLSRGIEPTASGKRCWAVLPSVTGLSPADDRTADGVHLEIDPTSSARWSLTPFGEKVLSSLFPAT